MTIESTPVLFLCPVCRGPLMLTGHTFRCAAGHSFDRAKEGYVNLLLKGKFSGDTKFMLGARREFLERGHFTEFAAHLGSTVSALLQKCEAPDAPVILDAGCGEGYYLRHLAAYLHANGFDAQLIGIDVSKDAIGMAAKRQPNAMFAVADLTQPLLLSEAALNVIVNLFAPHNFSEFKRILAPGGALVIGFPTERHFAEVRAALGLLNIGANKEDMLLTRAGAGWQIHERATVEYQLSLTRADLARFITMSPNQWHSTSAQMQQLESIETIDTTASFVLLTLIKQA